MVSHAVGRVTIKGYAWRVCLGGLAFVTLIGCDEFPVAESPDAQPAVIRPEKAVTHITAPLDDRAWVDYLKAANERHAKGVTADNNWEVAVRRAVGPDATNDNTRATYFEMLGVPIPIGTASTSPRFAPLTGTARSQFAQLDGVWVVDDFPELAEWLRQNEEALDRLAEGARRTHCYLPYLATAPGYRETLASLRSRFAGASAATRDVILKELVSGLNTNSGPLARHYPLTLRLLGDHQDVARGFFARAMFRLGKNDVASARQDLIVLHHIAHLTSQGMLPQWVVASSLEQLAARGDAALLASEALSPGDAEECLRALTTMPTLVPVADKIDIDDRHVALDAMQFAAANERLALSELERFQDDRIDLVAAIIGTVNWNLAMRALNDRFDRLVAAARQPDPVRRQTAFEAMRRARREFETWTGASLIVALENALESEADELAQWLAEVYFVRSSTPGVIGLEIEAKARRDVIRAGFAAHLYRLEKGHLPETIDDLTPRLRQLPLDGFTGKPLLFRPSPAGLVIYSVGRNGVDDLDVAAAEDKKTDDIRILVK